MLIRTAAHGPTRPRRLFFRPARRRALRAVVWLAHPYPTRGGLGLKHHTGNRAGGYFACLSQSDAGRCGHINL
jgi:hypothetical protein